jgi:Ca2+-transporting ATPase
LFTLVAAPFKSLFVGLLAVATVLALVRGEQVEAVAMLVVLLLHTLRGFLSQWQTSRALSALEKQNVPVALVIRDGAEWVIPASQLVPGDLVVLTAGARVPADGRIVESVGLRIDEAAFTGHSRAVFKLEEPLDHAELRPGERQNMAYLGSTITDGRGRLLVTATGGRTEAGRIGLLGDEAAERTTVLEEKLAQLGRMFVVCVLGLCAFVLWVGWLRTGHSFGYLLKVGLALTVAAVPEGLPAMATMALLIGTKRMARRGASVRCLQAVETLGATTVICTDKTGTLTRNEMTVCAFELGGRCIQVGGPETPSETCFVEEGQPLNPLTDTHLGLALRIGALCVDARAETNGERTVLVGDPTETALIAVAERAGLLHSALCDAYPRLEQLPFESATRRMVTVHRMPQEAILAFVKGAPRTVLEASRLQIQAGVITRLTPYERARWADANTRMAGAGMRVLALAYRVLQPGYSHKDLTRDLVFVGLVGMSDPIRAEAREAVLTCRAAGIRVVMITGDQKPTAAEIARQLGMDRDREGRPLGIVHGREMADMDAASFRRMVRNAAVFARVSPGHKLRIVQTLQEQGQIVAMTGDGVNDAPALKAADIGVAMGGKGTEVAEETADMVITDDNLSTIVSAVEQGRTICANILVFIHFLFSCNLSEILTVFLALLIGWPLPIGALQILWMNIITDIFPALALALEPSAPGIMQQPPRDPKEALLTPRFVGVIVWQGFLLAASALVVFGVGLHWYGMTEEGQRRVSTLVFMTLALSQTVHALSVRSQTQSAFGRRLFSNGWLWLAMGICVGLQMAAVYSPLLQRVLSTVAPAPADWALIAVGSLLPLLVVELLKLLRRLRPPSTRRVEQPEVAGQNRACFHL